MVSQAILLILCAALPGLLLRRYGPGAARFAALLALAAVAVAVLDLPREESQLEPASVVVVPTATMREEAAAVVARDLGGVLAGTDRREGVGVTAAEVGFESDTTPVRHRLARGRLRHREDPGLVLLWTGPLEPKESGSPQAVGADRLGTAVLGDLTPVALDPEAVEVRAVVPPRAGRPGALEVRLGAGDWSAVQVRLRIADPAGGQVLERVLTGAPAQQVEWSPAVVGAHTVRLDLDLGRVAFAGAGRVEVAPAQAITLVGSQASALARALKVQGMDAEVRDSLPEDLVGTLVLLDPIAAVDQSRVAEFVASGGGLFLVGGRNGGAVPGVGEPLAAFSPVLRLPLPPATPESGKGPGAPGDQPPSSEKPPDPTPPTPTDPPPKDPGGAAEGDTSGARLTEEEREVRRRAIAMVLVVDRSGSMGEMVKFGQSRLDIAKASALQTAQALDPQDRLGVVSFGERDGARVELEMTPVGSTAEIEKSLTELRPTARETRVRDGLRKARELLDGVTAAVKYAVVITDGAMTDVREAATHVEARRYVASGVTLVVIQVTAPGLHDGFDAATQTLALAKCGKGYAIQQRDFQEVPKVISAEVERIRTAVGRPKRSVPGEGPGQAKPTTDTDKPKSESPDKPDKPDKPIPPETATPTDPEQVPAKPDQPEPAVMLPVRVVEDSALLEPRPEDGFPPVAGILPVRGRSDARTLLVAGPEGIPLFATANRGLGRVAVWTADFLGPWGRAWVGSPAFPGRLAQWIAALAPADARTDSVRVLHRPEVSPAVPLPGEVAYLAALAGSTLRPLASYVAPSPRVRTEVRGGAADYAWYAVVFLLLLVTVEFFSMRRMPRRS